MKTTLSLSYLNGNLQFMTPNQPQPRPILRFPLSWVDILLELGAISGLLCCVVIAFLVWPDLRDRVPIHFGISGKPDAWGAKVIILILPVVAFILNTVFIIISRYPHTFNYPVKITPENARKQYLLALSLLKWLKLEIIWLFTLIFWQQMQVALGAKETLSLGLMISSFLVITTTVVIYLIQSYQNRKITTDSD